MRSIRTALLCLCSLAPTAAHAASVSLVFQNGNDGGQPFNTVEFLLANTSAPGINLTGFSMTVGDTTYNFDEVYLSRELFTGGNGTETAQLLIGDRNQDSVVTDTFQYAFTNFAPAVNFRGQFDIDIDNGSFDVNSRQVLFNNGVAPNAVASFTFSDGTSIEYTFEDGPELEVYTFSIPTPSAAWLPLVAGVAALRRRRP